MLKANKSIIYNIIERGDIMGKKYLLIVKKYTNPFKVGEGELMKAAIVDKKYLNSTIDEMHAYINDADNMQLEIKDITDNPEVSIKGGKC